MERAAEFKLFKVLVEGSIEQIVAGHTMSRMNPKAILCTAWGWEARYRPIMFKFCGNRVNAERECFHTLRLALDGRI
jgi:hypothetical protein